MNKTVIMAAVVVVGLFCLALAGYYLLTPANALLPFVPGYAPDSSKVHLTHAIVAFTVGAACLIYVWFQGGKKSTS